MNAKPGAVETPILITVEQFHEALGGAVGLHSLRAAVREGRIRSIRIGPRKRLIPCSELTAWLHRETVNT